MLLTLESRDAAYLGPRARRAPRAAPAGRGPQGRVAGPDRRRPGRVLARVRPSRVDARGSLGLAAPRCGAASRLRTARRLRADRRTPAERRAPPARREDRRSCSSCVGFPLGPLSAVFLRGFEPLRDRARRLALVATRALRRDRLARARARARRARPPRRRTRPSRSPRSSPAQRLRRRASCCCRERLRRGRRPSPRSSRRRAFTATLAGPSAPLTPACWTRYARQRDGALAQPVVGEDEAAPSPRPSARRAAARTGRGGPAASSVTALPVAVDGLLREADRRGRLERDAHDDRLAVADAALHAARAVASRCAGGRRRPGTNGSLCSLPVRRVPAKPLPISKPFDAGSDSSALREVGLELVEDRLAEARPARRARRTRPRRRASRRARRAASMRSSIARRGVGVGAAHGVRLDLRERHARRRRPSPRRRAPARPRRAPRRRAASRAACARSRRPRRGRSSRARSRGRRPASCGCRTSPRWCSRRATAGRRPSCAS